MSALTKLGGISTVKKNITKILVLAFITLATAVLFAGCSDLAEASSSLKSAAGSVEKAIESISEAIEEEPEDNVPTEYKNALKKAKTYSDIMHMSKAAIFDQLISEYGERFTEEEAQYAVDNLDVDFNENALAKAKIYYESMNMSKDNIYQQLISEYGEKFTPEEALYAVDNLD